MLTRGCYAGRKPGGSGGIGSSGRPSCDGKLQCQADPFSLDRTLGSPSLKIKVGSPKNGSCTEPGRHRASLVAAAWDLCKIGEHGFQWWFLAWCQRISKLALFPNLC